MSGRVSCPKCQVSLQLPDPSPAAVRCSNCQTTFRIAIPEPTLQPQRTGFDPLASGLPGSAAALWSHPRPPRQGVVRRAFGENQWLLWGLLGLGGVLLTCLGIAAWYVWSGVAFEKLTVDFKPPVDRTIPPSDFGGKQTATSPAARLGGSVPPEGLARFPELPPPRRGYQGSDFYFIDAEAARLAAPVSIRMHVYLPRGEHPPKSLPCVLIGPAGTNLLTGADVGTEPYPAETMPYIKAGMAVVFYSLPGELDEADKASEERLIAAVQRVYPAFRSSNGGVDNSKYALDFVLEKLPQVDPQKIFAAGHSSAGTLALMFAASEPRLAGCLAYAPCTDPVLRNRELLEDPIAQRLFPGCAEFLRSYSPMLQVSRYRLPLFVFHARDDSNTPFGDTEKFVSRLKAEEKTVDFQAAETGNHYRSMIEQGIPAGIEWIKKRLRK